MRHRRIHDGLDSGVLFSKGGKGRLERCELWKNADCGVWCQSEADPTLAACAFRDHTGGTGAGVYILSSAVGKATVGSDCVFSGNAREGVVRG